MTQFAESKTIINQFNNEVIKKTDTKNCNLLGVAITELLVYINFLDSIYNEYKVVSKQYMENQKEQRDLMQRSGNTNRIPDGFWDLYKRGSVLSSDLRLKIESFYLFGHILLTKATNFPARYFRHEFCHGLKFGSHTQFWKSMKDNSGFNYPPVLVKEVDWLDANLVDYRDKIITHTLSAEHYNRMLMKGFLVNEDGTTKLISVALYPDKKSKQTNSEELDIMIEHLQRYLVNYFDFLTHNSDKSILKQT